MTLSLNRWYAIAFPSCQQPVGIFVTVTDEDIADVDPDCFVLELESSADLLVEKVRITSVHGETLALCSNAMACINGGEHPVGIEADLHSQLVWTPEICPQSDWMPFNLQTGMSELSLYFSLLVDPDNVLPCDDGQPEAALGVDDPKLGTVAAWPMVFAVPGGGSEGSNPGKTIRVIWKKDL